MSEEKKSGTLLSVVPQLENGAHAKYKDSFKFIATFNNGDSGVCYAKSQTAPWEMNKVHVYTKKTGTSNNGTWVNIYFERPQDQQNGGSNGGSGSGRSGEDFRKSKAERIADMKVQCLVACSNVFQGAGEVNQSFLDSFGKIVELSGINDLTDGTQTVAPSKKKFDDTVKESMTTYLKSNEVSKIASVVISIKDYEIDQTQLLELLSVLIRPF